jgi:hypothetical protein
MPQLWAYLDGANSCPFRLDGGGSNAASLYVVTPFQIFWADQPVGSASPPEEYLVSTTVVLASDTTTLTFDASKDIWLLFAYKGSGATQLFLVRERSYTHIDAILTSPPFDSTQKQWAVFARITGADLRIFQQANTYLPLSKEGSMIYAHSVDGVAPVEPTELFMHPTGDTAPYAGQLLTSVPKPEDPTNTGEADPAWTQFGTSGATTITGDPLLRWKAGVPDAFAAGAADLICASAHTADAGDATAFLPSFRTATDLGLVQADPANPPAEGDMLVYQSGKWEPLRFAGNTEADVLTAHSGEPTWQHIAMALKALLTGSGDLVRTDSGGAVGRLGMNPAPQASGGDDRKVLMVKGSQPSWDNISDPLHPGNSDIGYGVATKDATNRVLVVRPDGSLFWALAQDSAFQ